MDFVTLTSHLQDILDEDVEYDECDAENNLKFMWDALSGLIRVMKDIDPLFRVVNTHRLVHAGSYYEGLRITTADEFDIQVVLDFPFPASSFTIRKPDVSSSLLTYQLKQNPRKVLYENHNWVFPYKKLATFFDNEGFLSSDKVLWWIHDLMEEALESEEFTIPRTISGIKRKQQASSCPAFTLEITGAYSGNTIDVDLVPVLSACSTKIPRNMHMSKRFRQLFRNQTDIQWFLVPKPSKDHRADDSTSEILWRSTFPAVEKGLLDHTGCLKDIIKLFKRLRDLNSNWRKPIYSYVLKSFFLEEFDKCQDLDYWSEDNLGTVFFESLEQFQQAMEEIDIPDYFSSKSNMVESINPNTAANIAGRVKNIISDLKENPDSILDIFHH